MRRLTKQPKPAILAKNEETWTREYIEAKAEAKKTPARWRHKQIRSALTIETSDRCAYCDSEMRVVHYGHIEHMLPRAHYPDLVVAWDNLTLACEKCNGTKLDFHSANNPLINPYVDEPKDHLMFLGDLVLPVPGSDRGRMTVEKLALSRKDLVDARHARIKEVHSLVENWRRAQDEDVKAVLLDIIIDNYRNGAYQATIEDVLDKCGISVGSG